MGSFSVLLIYSVSCSNIEDYVLKVAGQESYIHGFSQLLQFAYIVRSLGKRQDVELSLVRKVDPAGDQPREIPDVSVLHVIVM